MTNKKLLSLAKRYYEFVYKTVPTFATYLGIHKYDHLLGDFSKEALKRDFKRLKEFKREAKSLMGGFGSGFWIAVRNDEKAEEVRNFIDYRLLVSDIDANLRLLTKSKDYYKNPNIYLETPLVGIFLLISRDSQSLKEKVKSITSRLNLYPQMLSQGRANVKKAPKIYTQIALETLSGAKYFVSQVPGELKRLGKISSARQKALDGAAREALRALNLHEAYLVKLLQNTDQSFALGKNLFEQKLKKENLLNLDAERLLKLGQEEFSRIEQELSKVAAKISPAKTWPQLVEEYKNKTPQENLVSLYKKETKKLVKFIKRRDLVTFPKGEICIVTETPEFERPTVPYAAYMPPPVFEAKQVGFFWVTPINESAPQASKIQQLREHNLPSYMITTLHESYPGHHLQFCMASRVKSFVRKHGQSSLLCEGWALYCEQMMGEVGYYTDPKTKLFVLKDELWRAARVIIDVSLHCFGMAPESAVKLLVEKVKLAPSQAEAEVRRYTMSPTQPMSYLVGKLLILGMREKAQKLWGKNFSLKKFHDAFLACGTIPQPLIEKELFPKSIQNSKVKVKNDS